MFVSIAQHGHGAPGIIHDVATQHRLEIFDATSVAATPRPPMLQPSPLLDRIVASAQALASPAVRSAGAPQQPIHDGVGGDRISELLKEQRQIRVLLEEQNQLIKTHVSQTQELMHMARHQPSPQTVTRRYLRMRGTHTPTLTSTHRRTSDAGYDTANAVEDSGKLTMRRSNSLSEIVDGIRSFEVEGYEETQHHPSHGMRQPLSFTSPVYMAQSARAESPTATHSTAARSSATGSSINNLVSRINRLVGDSNAAQPAFERPPLPAHGRPQPRNLTLGSKVTPTTQKYLDSLGADDSPLPAPRHLS
ncbi:hypothetical protein H4S01_004066 [Coemansia sp. RSA 2610]|nr:hypothetical protein H4S01_004066 [Coemansia sp. RSA 2610]